MSVFNRPLYIVRWTWSKNYDIKKLQKLLKQDFEVILPSRPVVNELFDIRIGGHLTRDEILIVADSTSAYLSPIRAVIFQKQAIELTSHDVMMIDKVLKLYPQNTSAPFFTQRIQSQLPQAKKKNE